MKKLVFASLALTMWHLGSSAAERSESVSELQKSRAQLAVLLQQYTEIHPAAQRQRQHVAALEAQEQDNARGQLEVLLHRYTDLHPLVQQKRQQIAALQTPNQLLSAHSDGLKKARAELHTLLERYTEIHLLVQQKRTQIATLESARKSK